MIFVFNQKLSNRYDFSADKSQNALFLATAFLDLPTIKSLLKEYSEKLKLNRIQMQTVDSEQTLEKASVSNIGMRDHLGRHLSEYAAIHVQHDNLKFILESDGVLQSLNEQDQKNLINHAVASRSVSCLLYLIGTFGTFGILPEFSAPINGYFGDVACDKLRKIPPLKRKDIEAQFANPDDEALYEYLCQFPASSKQSTWGILLTYYYLGGSPANCAVMINRVKRLELSALAQKPGFNLKILVDLQREFSGFTWDDRKINAVPDFPHLIK